MRFMGVDWGRVRVGVALSDETGLIVRPLATVRADARATAAQEVVKLAGRESAAELVVGLPLNMDGSEGESARGARAFAEVLKGLTPLPVSLWDERMSSLEADRLAPDTDRDQAAACVMLQSFLNHRRAQERK